VSASPQQMSTVPPPREISLGRKLLYSTILVVLLLIFLEVAALLIFAWRYGMGLNLGRSRDPLHQYDPLLGWNVRPNQFFPHRYGPGKSATSNSQGFRAAHDYTPEVPWGRYRIVFLGDSFTYGHVGDAVTFPTQLEALWPTLEAVNMGHGAYGLDQLYLWYKRDGSRLQANLLLLALIEDDLQRMTTDTFLTVHPKPQLVAQEGKLVLRNVPVPTWGAIASTGWLSDFPKSTMFFKMLYKARGELRRYDLFAVVALLLADLQSFLQARHQQFVLVYLPIARDATQKQPPETVRRIAAIAREKHITFWNLSNMFEGLSGAELAAYFIKDGHYSARGNHLVAQTLRQKLREEFSDVPW
jgi:hypothetical protein